MHHKAHSARIQEVRQLSFGQSTPSQPDYRPPRGFRVVADRLELAAGWCKDNGAPRAGNFIRQEKSRVKKTRKMILTALAAVAMVAGTTFGIAVGSARAQSSAASPDTKQKQKNLTAGETEAKRLLLLMDRDQSGRVSKQEFMNFMEEEFQRLDINKDGELDVDELTRSRLSPHVGTHR
jgi:EF hand